MAGAATRARARRLALMGLVLSGLVLVGPALAGDPALAGSTAAVPEPAPTNTAPPDAAPAPHDAAGTLAQPVAAQQRPPSAEGAATGPQPDLANAPPSPPRGPASPSAPSPNGMAAGTTASTPAPSGAAAAAAGAPLGAAQTAEAGCPGNPDALGTSRVIQFDPVAMPYVGSQQYKQTLPLARGEVVLTFDDGPLPPMTNRVLDTLASECVKATFFIVGRMASAYPTVLQRTHREGHTIGTHSLTHPLIFPKLSQERGIAEISKGFGATNAVLTQIDAHTVPFFRFPGLGRTRAFETFTKENGISVFSVDTDADDWKHLKPEEVMKRALDRLEARGSGIVLLHDIQPATAVMLPQFLKELKKRHFKVVHVVAKEGGFTGEAGPAVRPAPLPAANPVATLAAPRISATGTGTAAEAPLPAARPESLATAAVAAPAAEAPKPAKVKKHKPQAAKQTAPTQAASQPQPAPFVFSWPRIFEAAPPAR